MRLLELTQIKFEYLTNPYYSDLGEITLEPTNDTEAYLERLTQTLIEIDGKSHSGFHEKMLKSFQMVKLRWANTYESGTMDFQYFVADQKEIADRHMGFFFN